MRILLATSELFPYSKTGGLADMVSALGKSLARLGHRVGVVTPMYGFIREKVSGLKKMDWKLSLPLDSRLFEGEVYTLEPAKNLTIYFVRQRQFFDRPGIYQENGQDYQDNAERYIFFSKAVANLAQYLPWNPEVVHVHDWQTALVPLLLKHSTRSGENNKSIKTCLTIHNLVYQGVYGSDKYPLLNLPWDYFCPAGVEFFGSFNFLKTGIVFADTLTTVSPTYAQEILGPEYGANLNGVLYQRVSSLRGILNGADYDEWRTEGNPAIPFPYSIKRLSNKAKNKAFLQEKMGLPQRPDIPLFANIGRMADQKGLDILLPTMEDILCGDIQFICLGSGASHYENAVRNLKLRFPGKVAIYIGYDPALAHQITAGSDFFVMPSRYEPCGLNQMYSLRYGTLPIVRTTGGLVDTVLDPEQSSAFPSSEDHPFSANGFKFSNYNVTDLSRAMLRAMSVYYSSKMFSAMRKNAMRADFSWDKTGRKYAEVYQSM